MPSLPASLEGASPKTFGEIFLPGRGPGEGLEAVLAIRPLAGARTPLLGGKDEPAEPSPAAAQRAERVLEGLGILLFLLIFGTALWIVIRGRL